MKSLIKSFFTKSITVGQLSDKTGIPVAVIFIGVLALTGGLGAVLGLLVVPYINLPNSFAAGFIFGIAWSAILNLLQEISNKNAKLREGVDKNAKI